MGTDRIPCHSVDVTVIRVQPCRYREQETARKYAGKRFHPQMIVVHRLDIGRTPREVIDAFLDGDAGKYTGFAVPYHFFIDKSGLIHQLLPLDARGAHSRGDNWRSFGIALDGDFRKHEPTGTQVERLRELCMYLGLQYDAKIVRHDQTEQATPGKVCPGKHLAVEHLNDELKRIERRAGDFMIRPVWTYTD